MLRLFELGMGVIEGTHEALQIIGRQTCCWQVPIRCVAANVIANYSRPSCSQGRQVPSVENSPLATFATPIHIGGDDICVAHDNDGLTMQLGRFGRHELSWYFRTSVALAWRRGTESRLT